MKKNGFTLAEALIALGIVAVAAAIAAPTMQNMMPDKNKTRVLQGYNDIVTATNVLLEDTTLYYAPVKYENDKPVVSDLGLLQHSCTGLACDGLPLVAPYKSDSSKYSGENKYPYLLMDRLKLDASASGNKITGKNKNNTLELMAKKSSYGYSLELTLNPRTNNCSYSAECKKNPNVFKFEVLNDGRVIAIDALSRAYLDSPNKTSKKADFTLAKEMLKSPVNLDKVIGKKGDTSSNNTNSGDSGNSSNDEPDGPDPIKPDPVNPDPNIVDKDDVSRDAVFTPDKPNGKNNFLD